MGFCALYAQYGFGPAFAKANVNGSRVWFCCPTIGTPLLIPSIPRNSTGLGFSFNKISLSDWTQRLEPSGAVFLPLAGARTINGFHRNPGGYHSSDATDTYHLHFTEVIIAC